MFTIPSFNECYNVNYLKIIIFICLSDEVRKELANLKAEMTLTKDKRLLQNSIDSM
jgi:hypothetical protein